MPIQLLASQTLVLERLTLLALTSKSNLNVLIGETGSGKSAILDALAKQSNACQCVKITYQHAVTVSQFRQQILLAFAPKDVFIDDEKSLIESIQLFRQSIAFPLCIIIDNADFLPVEIWQECIELANFKFCHGFNNNKDSNVIKNSFIQLVFSVNCNFLKNLQKDLSPEQYLFLQHIEIPKLTIFERQWLYKKLLSLRSNLNEELKEKKHCLNNFINAELCRQDGSPRAVIDLLAKKLSATKNETNARVNIQPKISMGLLVLITSLLIIFSRPVSTISSFNQGLFVPSKQSIKNNKLANLYDVSNRFLTINQAFVFNFFKLSHVFFENFNQKMAKHISFAPSVVSKLSTKIDKIENPVEKQVDNLGSTEVYQAPKPIKGLVLTKESIAINTLEKSALSRPSGYTLQLASLKMEKSVQSFRQILTNEADTFISRHKGRWVIFFGKYSEKTMALAEANRLMQRYKLSKPMLKDWSNLQDYKIQSLFHSEIPR